jgi:hypothetical protein
VPSVGRYLEINTSETLKSNLAWVYFTLEYSQSDVDELSLNESTLGFYWFNTSNSEWQRLNSSNSWMASWVYGSGVDTTQNFVWTNVSHFSAYTIGGSTLSERLDIPLIIGWNLFSLPLNVL